MEFADILLKIALIQIRKALDHMRGGKNEKTCYFMYFNFGADKSGLRHGIASWRRRKICERQQ